ncbi:hypothetical protein PCANC_19668 [Puccinia coronata f. sp. avenae]|uniref:Secreted protein n=1 Tax=Puccinia coronata f. sp. avenae TaxID=200324 RepID=A0A2N5SAV9_9BASI|nr:hypothetical protein PCANC_19668 [Puccinia coronata f. sp. avenae]
MLSRFWTAAFLSTWVAAGREASPQHLQLLLMRDILSITPVDSPLSYPGSIIRPNFPCFFLKKSCSSRPLYPTSSRSRPLCIRRSWQHLKLAALGLTLSVFAALAHS